MSYSDLANCEANYMAYVEKHLKNPTESSLMQLARKQLTIDDIRCDLKLGMLWYNKKELRKILNDEDLLPWTPRQPLDISFDKRVGVEDSCSEGEEEEEVERVVVGRYEMKTITLGKLIEKLTKLKDELGYNAPVFRAEMGAAVPVTDVEKYKRGVCIA